MTAFLSGANAWLETMPAAPVEYGLLGGVQPWLPAPDEHDVVAASIVFMAWSLSGNWDTELLRVEIADRLGWEGLLDLFPDLDAQAGPVIAGTRGGPNRAGASRSCSRPPSCRGARDRTTGW